MIVIILLEKNYGNESFQKMDQNSKYKKVIVIGIDGMDPKITNKLMNEGKLPNFKKLAQSGSFMNLNTSYPPHSPVAWTSIATGMNPGKHNIFDFIRRDTETHTPQLSLSKATSGISGTKYESYVKADPFWKITSNAGIATTVIRWPMTFPPEKVDGKLLSGLGVPDIRGFLSGYAVYTSENMKAPSKDSKIIKVSVDNGIINSELSGPRIRKAGDIVEVKIPLKVELSDDGGSATLIVQGVKYAVEVGGWSDWIRAKFKAGLLKNVHGIFRAYLISADPFEMYITTIQVDPENPVVEISAPKQYSKDLADKIGLYYTLGMPEETGALIDGRLTDDVFLQQVTQIEEERQKMFWFEFDNFMLIDAGVYAFVFDSSDRLQHMFWDEKVLEEVDEGLSVNKVVVDYYIEKDALVGKIVDRLDEQTALIIISDHGFTSFERAVSLNTWLVENGFMTLTTDIKADDEGGLFKYVNWGKTQAYSLGFNSIYINLEGREGKGVVKDREKTMDEVIVKLEALTDDKTGAKVVNKVYRNTEIYSGQFVKDGPDMIVGFNPGFRMSWETAIGGFTEDVIYDNTKKWGGDHLMDPQFIPGVFFSNFATDADTASQMDVAPTVLDALGIDVPEKIDGKSLLT